MQMIITCASEPSISGNTMTGTAHAFGSMALMGGRYETLLVGAFDKALQTSDARAFLQHDPTMLLGRQSSNTLRLLATQLGLDYALDLPNTSYANDLRELVARGDLNEMSFAFIPGQVKWAKASDGLQIRAHVSVAELVDISPVSIPAFGGTSIQMRSKSYFYESLKAQLIRLRSQNNRLDI